MGKDQSWANAAGSQQVPRKYTPLIRRRQTKENETRLLCLLCCCVAARLLRLLRCCVALRLLRCCVAARLLRCCAFAVLLRLLCCCALAVLRDVSGLRRARVRCKTLRLPGSAVARAPPAAGRKQETVCLHGSAASRGPNAVRHSESARGCARPRPGEFYVAPQIGAGRESTPPNLHAGRGRRYAVLRAVSVSGMHTYAPYQVPNKGESFFLKALQCFNSRKQPSAHDRRSDKMPKSRLPDRSRRLPPPDTRGNQNSSVRALLEENFPAPRRCIKVFFAFPSSFLYFNVQNFSAPYRVWA